MMLSRSLSILSVAAALFAGCIVSASAQTLQDVSRLMKSGQHIQALDQVEKYLAAKPKDPQARFVKGIVLTEMGRSSEAIPVFQKLTEDYPELPEPYNNLAVIYAQQKQYEKAKQALEMAIRTHPSYATAHENLGDIYARMASQAYDKALQFDSSNTSAQTKLSMIRELMGNRASQIANITAPTSVASAAPTPVQPKPAVVPELKPAPVATAPVVAPPVPQPATPPVIAKAPEPKPAAPAVPPPAKPAAANPAAAVTTAVESWAAAWSRKDVKAYLASYAKDFATPGGVSRTQWEKEREQRIDKPGDIKVGIEDLRVTPEGADKAKAQFRQNYQSANFKTTGRKTLVMVLKDGKWLIQQEMAGK